MTDFDDSDRKYMRRALELAAKGMFTAHPNPRVGCVLVRDNKVVGEGWHHKTGAAHAEVNALRAAGADAAGSTAYVTLEPCSHTGKTPPCADALVKANVASVIVALEDPNPNVSGCGIETLRSAGIDVAVGLLFSEARRLNQGFISRMSANRPMVRLKIAASLDGATAMKSGESQWITGEEARHDVQKLRASSGAILTGIETVLKDDPSLNVRDESLGADLLQPRRVVLDSRLRMPPTARMLTLPGETIVFCNDDGNRPALAGSGATLVKVGAIDGRLDLHAVMSHLAQIEVNDVLVEAGPVLAGALLTGGLVDELVIYQAPHIMGSETRGMIETPGILGLDQRIEFKVVDSSILGKDTRLTLRPE